MDITNNNNTISDEIIKNNNQVKLYKDLHLKYLLNLDKTNDLDAIGYHTNEYLKMGAFYWGIGAVSCLESMNELKKSEIIDFVLKCQNINTGGFGGCIGHDETITNTHYAILILIQLDSLDKIDKDKVAEYFKSLQNKNGSFRLDKYGESDTRFSYCAASCLTLLGKTNYIDIDKATKYVLACQNFDGGFGGVPGAESHAAYTFCCIGYLGILKKLNSIYVEKTCQWLAARQTHLGGFNGRPEKLPDVCYSWWILSCFYVMKKDSYIDKELLIDFILKCQDNEEGGISDRPGNCNDVFHTFFGLAALSLLDYKNLVKIDPYFAIDERIIKRMNLLIS